MHAAAVSRRGRTSMSLLPALAIAFCALAALAAYLYIYVGGHYLDPHVYPVIRGDGAGYYLYLPADLLQHDPTLHQFVAHDLRGFSVAATGLHLDPGTGNYLDKYSIGEAVMLLPFFLVGHLLALLAGQPANGFSSIEQVAAGLGGLAYMVLGLAVLARSLARYVRPAVVAFTLLSLVFGTNLFHYATFDSMFSHTYAFFLVAALVELVHRWHERPASMAMAVWIGAVMGLIVLARPTNVVFGLLIPLFGANERGAIGAWLTFLRTQLPRFLLMVATGLVVFLPQLVVWHIATGHWLTNPYPGEGFNFAAPRFFDVLFRLYYHGFFPWSPIMILAVIGVAFMWRVARPMVVPTVVIFLINLWVIASWSTWFYGGGFGHRAFIDEFPLLAFGLAALYASARSLLTRVLVAVPALAAGLVTMVMMLHYWEFLLSPGGASREEYFRILFHRL